jgi:hypothetical protein
LESSLKVRINVVFSEAVFFFVFFLRKDAMFEEGKEFDFNILTEHSHAM